MRCNSCGYYPSSLSTLTLHLTSCGHLVCSKCLEGSATSTTQSEPPESVECLECKQPCKTVEVGPDSEPGPDVKFYFNEETEMVKKVLQAAMFQNMHYEVRVELEKRERLLPEIGEAQRQEKELADIEEKVAASQVSSLLEAVREKFKNYLTPPQELNSQQTSHASPSQSGVQSTVLQPTTSMPLYNDSSLAGQTYSAQPSMSVPLNKYSSLPGQNYPVQERSSTLTPPHRPPSRSFVTPPTSAPQSKGSMSCDTRVKANLLAQSQMQNWSQQQHPQQKQSTSKTPIFSRGVHHFTRPVYSPQLQHPLNSVHTMYRAPGSANVGRNGSTATGGPYTPQAMARRSTVTRSLVPGSTLS